uniref:Uncharacterized protein n=1 Tax=Triticum urartu TaxID=4572 RepID=A0A8R7TU67_TRIUA
MFDSHLKLILRKVESDLLFYEFSKESVIIYIIIIF